MKEKFRLINIAFKGSGVAKSGVLGSPFSFRALGRGAKASFEVRSLPKTVVWERI